MRIHGLSFVSFSLAAALLCGAEASQAADWRPVGPGGGAASQVVADPLVPGRLFATWFYGPHGFVELYRKDPGGPAWSLATRGLERNVGALAFHPARPGTMWTATSGPLAVYRSTDAGGSWQRRASLHSAERALGLWSLRQGNRAVLFGWFGSRDTGWRLTRSLNEGQTWAPISGVSGVSGVEGPAAVLDATATVYAVGDGGLALFESRNAGGSWRRIGPLPFAFDANAEVPSRLFAFAGRRPALFASSREEGLFRSTDGGRSWRPAGPAGAGPTDIVARGAALFAAFESGLHDSVDGGATWRLRNSPGLPQPVVSLAGAASSPLLHAVSATSPDLFESRDGRTWTRVPKQGVQMFAVLDFAWHPRDPRLQAMVRIDPTRDVDAPIVHLLSTRDGGTTWRDSALKAFAFDPLDAGILYGASEQGVFAARTGEDWMRLREEPTTTVAHTGMALLAGGCGIARSADHGGQWTETLPCLAPAAYGLPAGGTLRPQRIVAHPTHPAVVWAEVSESYTREDGGTEQIFRLYGSFDGGLTWERHTDFYPRVALVPGLPDTVWNFGGVPVRSDDRGETWTRVFVPGKIYGMAVDPLDGNHLVAVGERTAQVTHNNGASWSPAFPISELTPWGSIRQNLSRVYLHPTQAGRIVVAPGLGLLQRNAPIP